MTLFVYYLAGLVQVLALFAYLVFFNRFWKDDLLKGDNSLLGFYVFILVVLSWLILTSWHTIWLLFLVAAALGYGASLVPAPIVFLLSLINFLPEFKVEFGHKKEQE